jgi:hypothetical protein
MERGLDWIRQTKDGQINKNLIDVILEFVGMEESLNTKGKINSKFKALVQNLFKNQINLVFEYKKLLLKYDGFNYEELIDDFYSFYRNQDENWHCTKKFMSNLLSV